MHVDIYLLKAVSMKTRAALSHSFSHPICVSVESSTEQNQVKTNTPTTLPISRSAETEKPQLFECTQSFTIIQTLTSLRLCFWIKRARFYVYSTAL